MRKIQKNWEFGLHAPSKTDLIWLETEIWTFWGVFTQLTYVHWTASILFCKFFEIYKKNENFFFNCKKKVGEAGPIAKPSEMSNIYALKSGQEKFGTDSSQGTISFWDLRVERGNA